MELTVVMYHYIRDLKNSRYPLIKGLDVNLFKGQIEYLQKHYNFVTIEQIIAAYNNQFVLPNKSVLLTFDDAYVDHFTNVFPILYKKKIQGAFFPPVKAVTEHTVLDVNKIHFILASTNISSLLTEIEKHIQYYKHQYNLNSFEEYFNRLAIANRFDSKEVIFVKRLLQVELEETLRNRITDQLFSKFVSSDEGAFSRELYMSEDQLCCMISCGMHVGAHGYDHYWLGSLSEAKQQVEIEKSINFIQRIGGDISTWTICYPYGNYNEITTELLNKYKCRLGFTTKVAVANINSKSQDERLVIPRLDTNDLPKGLC